MTEEHTSYYLQNAEGGYAYNDGDNELGLLIFSKPEYGTLFCKAIPTLEKAKEIANKNPLVRMIVEEKHTITQTTILV